MCLSHWKADLSWRVAYIASITSLVNVAVRHFHESDGWRSNDFIDGGSQPNASDTEAALLLAERFSTSKSNSKNTPAHIHRTCFQGHDSEKKNHTPRWWASFHVSQLFQLYFSMNFVLTKVGCTRFLGVSGCTRYSGVFTCSWCGNNYSPIFLGHVMCGYVN